MKQETLEEVAENYTIDFSNMSQWQQERSYSEEDINLRKKLWVDVYIAYVSTPNSYNRDGGYIWADKALERFDEQFKNK